MPCPILHVLKRSLAIIFAPLTVHQAIVNAWIHKQVELLSRQFLSTGIDIQPAASESQEVYVIEHNGETAHCSPEQAYATLPFLKALQEREQQDIANSQSVPRISL